MFLCLKELDHVGIKYTYIPFTQGATVHALDPKWRGFCENLSYQWVLRKASAEDMAEQTTYKIELSDVGLPHPVIVDDSPELIKEVNCSLAEMKLDVFCTNKEDCKFYHKIFTDEEDGIDALFQFIICIENHYGTITITKTASDEGHSVAFAKRGQTISFFEPNHGEIVFTKNEDFYYWFKLETKEGNLQYLNDQAEYSQIDFFNCDSGFPKTDYSDDADKLALANRMKKSGEQSANEASRDNFQGPWAFSYSIKSYASGQRRSYDHPLAELCFFSCVSPKVYKESIQYQDKTHDCLPELTIDCAYFGYEGYSFLKLPSDDAMNRVVDYVVRDSEIHRLRNRIGGRYCNTALLLGKIAEINENKRRKVSFCVSSNFGGIYVLRFNEKIVAFWCGLITDSGDLVLTSWTNMEGVHNVCCRALQQMAFVVEEDSKKGVYIEQEFPKHSKSLVDQDKKEFCANSCTEIQEPLNFKSPLPFQLHGLFKVKSALKPAESNVVLPSYNEH